MKVKRNIFDIVIEVVCLILVSGTIIYMMVRWSFLPSELPMHYNAAGEIDRWGSKGELVIMPVIMCITYILLTVIEQFPETWNTGVKVTPFNRARVYRTLKYMLNTLKLLTVGTFAFITINSMGAMPLPVWFTLVNILLILGDIVFWMIKLLKIK